MTTLDHPKRTWQEKTLTGVTGLHVAHTALMLEDAAQVLKAQRKLTDPSTETGPEDMAIHVGDTYMIDSASQTSPTVTPPTSSAKGGSLLGLLMKAGIAAGLAGGVGGAAILAAQLMQSERPVADPPTPPAKHVDVDTDQLLLQFGKDGKPLPLLETRP